MSEETKTTESAAPVETVGDIMSEATRATMKKLVLFLSAVVYVAAIVYAEVHGMSQLQAGVKEDMRFWATLGMIAAGVTAVCFPLALKTWCFDTLHRIMCIIFYILDFAFLAFNAFTDFNVQTGQQLAPWAQSYLYYVLPASPLIVGAMWAILWELDPSTRAYTLRQTLKASIMEAKAKQIATRAKMEVVNQRVEAAADREVESALTELFGAPVTVRDPRQYEQVVRHPAALQPRSRAVNLSNENKLTLAWRETPDGARIRQWCEACLAEGKADWSGPTPCEHVLNSTSREQISLDEATNKLEEIINRHYGSINSQEGADQLKAPFQPE